MEKTPPPPGIMQKKKMSMTTIQLKVSSELGNLANCGIFNSCFNVSQIYIYEAQVKTPASRLMKWVERQEESY